MDEKKKYYTQAQNKATQKYIKNNLEDIRIRVPKGHKEKYKIAAKAAGLSVNKFFIDAAEEKIKSNELIQEVLAKENLLVDEDEQDYLS